MTERKVSIFNKITNIFKDNIRNIKEKKSKV